MLGYYLFGMLKEKNKSLDLILLIIWPLAAAFLSIKLHAVFLATVFLFFVIPCVFLVLRKKKNIKKVIYASFTLGLILSFTFDFLAEFNNAWNWNGGLLTPHKIFGIVQVDVLFWFFFWVMYFILFYEHFIDDEKYKKISRNAPLTFGLGILLGLKVIITKTIYPSFLYIPYAYLVLCLGILLVFIIMALYKPKLVRKIMPVSAYFFFVYLTYELTALHTEIWTFPGQYIGTVRIMSLEFPFEELIFWILLSSTIGVTYYEFAFDDEK